MFSVFIVAFGLAFYVLLSPSGEVWFINLISIKLSLMDSEFQLYFESIPRSLLKMAEYLLGELEFEFYITEDNMPYPGLTWIMVLIAVIFLPIIFMNLLVSHSLKNKWHTILIQVILYYSRLVLQWAISKV